MSNFNIDNFITEINRSGISRSNRFEVQILPPTSLQSFTNESRLVSLFCDITNLPGMSIATKGLKLYGPAYQRPISSEFNGEAINMTFYLDRGMNVKAFFDAWMFKTVNPNSFNVSYANDYVSQIKITQLDEKNVEQYSIYLEDAFPRAMSLVDLSAGSVNQASKLNMTFAYRRWFSEHPAYSGIGAKTNFDPKLKDPFSFTPTSGLKQITPPSNQADRNIGNPMGDISGAGAEPYRLEIRGTGG